MYRSIASRFAAALISAVSAVIAAPATIAAARGAKTRVNDPKGGNAMNRRQMFLSTAKAALASAVGGSWLGLRATAAQAQVAKAAAVKAGPPQMSVLPYPDPEFKGVIGRTTQDSKPDFPQPVSAPEGAPNVLLILTDDVGFGASSAFGGPVPTPTLEALAANGLRYNEFNTTALCSPTRAALITGRDQHTVHTGIIMERGECCAFRWPSPCFMLFCW